MANYRCSIKPIISRGKGGSVVRAAAYISRDSLHDERTGETYDYSGKKEEALFVGIYAPKNAPEWAHDVEKFTNEIERSEKRKDAQTARPVELSLAHELTLEQNKWMLQDFIKENVTRKGYAALAAIHAPPEGGDERNIHAHLLISLRTIDENGFSKTKKEEHDNYLNKGQILEDLRASWEKHLKHHLERHGFHEQAADVSCKSLKEQGIEREPTRHLGPSASDMERKGKTSERGHKNREIKGQHQDHAKLKKEHADLTAEIAALEREERKAKELEAQENPRILDVGDDPFFNRKGLGNKNKNAAEQGLDTGLNVATGVVGVALRGIEGLADFLFSPVPKRPEERLADQAQKQADAKVETKAERRARLMAEGRRLVDEARKREQEQEQTNEQNLGHDRGRKRER